MKLLDKLAYLGNPYASLARQLRMRNVVDKWANNPAVKSGKIAEAAKIAKKRALGREMDASLDTLKEMIAKAHPF